MAVEILTPVGNWIRQTHYDTLRAAIRPPIADPAPDRPDRGYGDVKRTATFVSQIARAMGLREIRYVRPSTNASCRRHNAEHVGGEWIEIVEDATRARYESLPGAERERLHASVCARLTAFQNHFLETPQGRELLAS